MKINRTMTIETNEIQIGDRIQVGHYTIPPPARLCLAKAWLFSFWTSISTRPCR